MRPEVKPEDIPIEDQDESEDEPNEPRDAAHQDQEEEWRQQLRGLAPEDRQRLALDDVPLALKKRLHEDEDDQVETKRRRVTEALVTQVALGTLAEPGKEHANEWVSRYELDLLRHLTGLPLTAARIHRAPRKRLARPPKLVSRGRLSILLGKDTKDAFVVEETPKEVDANPRRRVSFPWKGITMYYKEKPKGRRDKVRSYVEKDGEIYEVMWSSRQRKLFEREWLQELKDILLSEVMLLKMKASGKELDPKFFNDEEKEKFRKSDAAEWKQWIDNGVIPYSSG